MTEVTYPCYVKIQGNESDESEECIELPTEENGKMLLTTITSQFTGAVGLRYKSETGAWRIVRLIGDVFDVPIDGWGDCKYYVVKPVVMAVVPKKAEKRMAPHDKESPVRKLSRMTEQEILTDLGVFNLPYNIKDAELRAHFEQYGELEKCHIKLDKKKKSRGFAFIRYKTVEAVKAVLQATHIVKNRELDVTFPQVKVKSKVDDPPPKLFVGRLPPNTTKEEIIEHFKEFGGIRYLHIPSDTCGYCFVLYKKKSAAVKALAATHLFKGQCLNVLEHVPKEEGYSQIGYGNQGHGNQGYGIPGYGTQGFGNMQGMPGHMPRGMLSGMFPRTMQPRVPGGYNGNNFQGNTNYGSRW